MEWVDLGLKRSDEYWEGQAAVVAGRFQRSFEPVTTFLPIGTAFAVGCLVRLARGFTFRMMAANRELQDHGYGSGFKSGGFVHHFESRP